MARISTGQTYGETGRATSQRLLGGAEQMAIGGALAQQSLNVPALQPQAAPVETFQQVGAPTIGGPPKMFAPPELPAPSQDMAKLAAALGSFSPVLQGFASNYVQQQKDLSEKRQEEAKQFIANYESSYGASRGLMETKRFLENAAAKGDAGADRLLTYLMSRHPGMLGYINEASQDAAVMNNAADLSRRLANQQTVDVNGQAVPTKTLAPDSPAFRNLVESYLIPEGGISARVYTKHAALMASARNSALLQQEKSYLDNNVQNYIATRSKDLDATVNAMFSNKARPEDVFNKLQELADRPYLDGIRTDEANKLRDQLGDAYAESIAAWQKRHPEYRINPSTVLLPLRMLMGGPEKERFNAEGQLNANLLLTNILGGQAYLSRLEGKLQTAILETDTQQRQADALSGRISGQELAMQYMPDSAAKSPTAIRTGADSARQYIMRTEKDPDRQAAMLSEITTREKQLTEAFTEPEQRNREMWYTSQYERAVQDPQFRQRLQSTLAQDLSSGAISDQFYKSQTLTLVNLGNKTVEGYRDVWQAQAKERLDNWKKISGSPDSYGEQQITGFELNALIRAEQQMDAVGRNAVAKALQEGKDPVKAVEEAFKGRNFGLRERPRGPQQQAYKSLDDLVNANTGWASRNAIAPDKANELKAKARVRPLFDRKTLLEQISIMGDGGQPSQQMRTVLRALTTGPNRMTTSEALMLQLKQHGLVEDIDPTVLQKIKNLDNTLKLSSAQPRQQPGGVNPALVAINSLFTPPAAAATRPKGGGLTGVATYYAGSGGSDGIIGGRTANGEIFTGNKMTAAVQWGLFDKYRSKWVRVEDLDTGRSIRVWVNDTGQMGGTETRPRDRVIDLSPKAFKSLYGSLSRGTGRIRLSVDPNQKGRP